MPRNIVSRVWNKLSLIFYRINRVDKLTHIKVNHRQDLKEIGSVYGGWVIPLNQFNESSICYCAGCGEDITFDLGLIDKFNCHVYGFDPTPRAIKHIEEVAHDNGHYHFDTIGLWDEEDTLKFFTPKNTDNVSHSLVNLQKTEDYIEVNVKSLKQIMHENNHHKLDLLKLDIEGAEYKVIESILEDNLDIKVICVEYDECFNALDDGYKNRIKKSVNLLLSNGYSLVCAQGNGNYTLVK